MSHLFKKILFPDDDVPADIMQEDFLEDPNAILNLVEMEFIYVVKDNYFSTTQKYITPSMRKLMLQWVLQVFEIEKCCNGSFSMTVNIVDRFLAKAEIGIEELQLLGGVCIMLATKLCQNEEVPAQKIIEYCCEDFTIEDLNVWQCKVLSTVDWHINSIVPNDYCKHFYYRLPDFYKIANRVCPAVDTYIKLVILEFELTAIPPSLIAIGCIATAIRRIEDVDEFWPPANCLVDLFHQMTEIEENSISNCIDQIDVFISTYLSVQEQVPPEEANAAASEASVDKERMARQPYPPSLYPHFDLEFY